MGLDLDTAIVVARQVAPTAQVLELLLELGVAVRGRDGRRRAQVGGGRGGRDAHARHHPGLVGVAAGRQGGRRREVGHGADIAGRRRGRWQGRRGRRGAHRAGGAAQLVAARR